MATGIRQTSAHIQDASIFDSTVEPESHIQGASMSSVGKINILLVIYFIKLLNVLYFFINDFLVPFSFDLH